MVLLAAPIPRRLRARSTARRAANTSRASWALGCATRAPRLGSMVTIFWFDVKALIGIEQWQIFYHRGETWGNPLSSVGNESAGTAPTATTTSLPNGVRLVLTLSTGQAMQGTLTRDWVRPTLEAGQ